jgi:hypothetical protein
LFLFGLGFVCELLCWTIPLHRIEHPKAPTCPTDSLTPQPPGTRAERVLGDISFGAPEKAAAARAAAAEGGDGCQPGGGGGGEAGVVRVVVTAEDVRAAVGPLLEKVDLSKYML